MRPRPPFDVDDPLLQFAPAPELEAWARATFIDDDATAANPDHAHLQQAAIGFCWTNKSHSRAGRRVLGTCELMPPMAMGTWSRARAEHQMVQWFGEMPDFLITIDANAADLLDDRSFMALVEHELMHIGQATDEFGMPRFNKQTGKPIYALRGHSVEEFTSIVRRYGACDPDVAAMVEAAQQEPEIGRAVITRACGVCLKAVA